MIAVPIAAGIERLDALAIVLSDGGKGDRTREVSGEAKKGLAGMSVRLAHFGWRG